MIVSIGEGGASFSSAGRYFLGEGRASIATYMLDQNENGTRVGFTETLNLPTQDASEGFQAMDASYDRYRELNAKRPGRKLNKPVYHYSLSWSPDERVTKVEMMRAAKETLKVLGMDGHQAIITEHTDKEYQHIHVIVSRINSDMTKAASTSMDQYKVSKWAEAYERERGTIFCERRVENNKRREMGESVKDTFSKSRQEIEAERLAQKQANDKGFDSPSFAKVDRDSYLATRAVYDEATERMEQKFYNELNAVFISCEKQEEANRLSIKQDFKPQWREIYKYERDAVKHIKEIRNSIFERVCYIYMTRKVLEKLEPLGISDMAKMALSERKLLDRIELIFKKGRAELGDQQKEAITERIEQTRVDRNRKLNSIADRQDLEREAFNLSKSEDLARYSPEQVYEDIPATSFLDRTPDGVWDQSKSPERNQEGQSFLDRVEQDHDLDNSTDSPSLDDENDRGL